MTSEHTVHFRDLALPPNLNKAIDGLGFENCTPIQGAVLPYSLSDYDVTGQAQTGTGKTAAFLITILTQQIEYPRRDSQSIGVPRALILAPTRELALQIESDAKDLGKYLNTHVVAVVGGMDFDKQRQKIEQRPLDILVATPGRLIDFCQRRVISLREVEVLVIDEADRMLDMGFIPDVRRIVYQTPKKRARQTLFFSATFNDDVMNLAQQWTIDPTHVVIEADNVATDSVDQKFWLVEHSSKSRALLDFLKVHNPQHTLVFVNRRDAGHRLVSFLSNNNIACEALAGDIPQRKRLSTLNRFKEGATNLVIATDVAGRGIHVEGITHVVNYDLPEDAEDYVHRIGRTGRAGATGTAISFVSEDDAFNLPAIEQYLGETIQCVHPEL